MRRQSVEGRETRGGILAYALDSEDRLREQDQGVSFGEFVRLILSPKETDRVESLVAAVRAIPELSGHHAGKEDVRHMVTRLQREADKVMRTNRRLSTTIRRLLDDRTREDRRRIAALLREIREHATGLAGRPPDDELGIELEVELAIESPFRREFWTEPRELAGADLVAFEANEAQREAAFREFADLPHLDWKELRGRIRSVADFRERASLSDVLAVHPAESGVVEVLALLQIAREDGHDVDRTRMEDVTVGRHDGRGRLVVRVPLVHFRHTGGNERE